jgi:hypothetical protein
MSCSRAILLGVFTMLTLFGSQPIGATEAKRKVSAQPAVKKSVSAQSAARSRNYGAVQIRTADLTPRTKFDFQTIQWGFGPGYSAGYYGYAPGWAYSSYSRPYAAYYPYYYSYRPYYAGYRPYGYAFGPGYYGYYGPSYSYYGGPAYVYSAGPSYAGRGYGGCYHW